MERHDPGVSPEYAVIVAVDFDGTLVPAGSPPYTTASIAALLEERRARYEMFHGQVRRFSERGGVIAFCTGRGFDFVRAVSDRILGTQRYIFIGESGADIRVVRGRQISDLVPPYMGDMARFLAWKPRAEQQVKRLLGCQVQAKRHIVTFSRSPDTDIHHFQLMVEAVLRDFDPEMYGELTVTHSSNAVDIMKRTVNKGAGLSFVCQKFNIPRSVMIGDAENDWDALLTATVPVLVGNATPDFIDRLYGRRPDLRVMLGHDLEGVSECFDIGLCSL